MTDRTCIIGGCTERVGIMGPGDFAACSTHGDELHQWERAVEQAEHEALHGTDPLKQLCPRRIEDGAGTRFSRTDDPELPDTWSHRSQMAGGIRALHCDYCGSLHPDRFMKLVKEGAEVGPTDKTYKVYLHSPEGGMESKFYFQHLSEDQRREFVELINAGTLRIGYPGHFYVPPFFARFAPPDNTTGEPE